MNYYCEFSSLPLFLELSIFCTDSYSLPFLRYPYEAIHVITSDGYVLLLERIPRYKFLLIQVVFDIKSMITIYNVTCAILQT